MKSSLALLLLLCVPFAATLSAKTESKNDTTKKPEKANDIESDPAVVEAAQALKDAKKALAEAEAKREPREKLAELAKAKDEATKALSAARKAAREAIAAKNKSGKK